MCPIELNLLSKEFCENFLIFAEFQDDSLELQICNESDLSILNYLYASSETKIKLKKTTQENIISKTHNYYNQDKHKTSSQYNSSKSKQNDSLDNKTVKQINYIIAECVKSRASDIHFEPYEKKMLCRARIDGILINIEELAFDIIPEILSRIKIMSGLDIAEKRRPQDGRIRFQFEKRIIDIRVSIIPTDFGEKAVLRILDKESLKLDLTSLGFTQPQLKLFEKKIKSPNGIILVTGPTGSGKTTTLYAALSSLKSESLNISTVEDPIEYNLEGINQTQVKPEINLTFSAMLRSLLRQDPNILMVGEIRDNETLEIAIRAALTGHLVFSTLHTNNAIATISRLIDMGGERMLLASTIKLIVAQRLVRLNCQNCLVDGLIDTDFLIAKDMNVHLSDSVKHSTGCEKCNNTGYYGRKAIYELFDINENIKNGINQSKTEFEILKIAQTHKFKTMIEASEDLINNGITTPSEILREISI